MAAVEFARWIDANQDKKGTAEFETVAKAFNVAQQKEASSLPADSLVDSSVPDNIGPPTQGQDPTRVNENLFDLPSPKRALDIAAENIADSIGIFGLPVDAVNEVMGLLDKTLQLGGDEPLNLRSDSPVGGSAALAGGLKSIFRKFGVEPKEAEVGNLAENLIGVVSSAVAPGGALLKGAKIADEVGTTNKVIESIARNPKTFAAGETVAATGGGIGRTGAEQVFPESEMAGIWGELLGMPTASLLSAGTRASSEALVFSRNNLTDEGSLNKASAEIQKTMQGSKEEALANINKSTDTPISGGKQTDDVGLLDRQRQLDEKNAELALENQKMVMENLTNKLDSLKGESGAHEFIRTAKENIESAVKEIDDSVNQAVEASQLELSSLRGATREDASRIARLNLEEARIRMDDLETQTWNKVELDVPVEDLSSVGKTREALADIVRQGNDGRDIPKDVVRLVDSFLFQRDFIPGKKGTRLKEGLTVKTLQNMRSRVLSELKKSSTGANPDANRSALLSQIQKALLDDMEAVSDVSPDLLEAIAVSKRVNNMFNRGKIGSLLGRSSDQSLKVDPDLTLSKVVEAGEEGGVNLRDFLNADSSPSTKRAIGDYVQQMFLSQSVTGGKFDPKSAKAFMETYSSALNHLPEVRTMLNRAIRTGDVTESITEQAVVSRKALQKTALSTFLRIEDPRAAIETIRKSKTPTQSLTNLVEEAQKDPTGSAIEGLRTIVAEDLLKFLTKAETVPGSRVKKLSSANAQKALTGVYRDALEKSGLYDDDQLTLIDSIVSDLDINERTVSAKLPTGSGTAQSILGSQDEVLSTGFRLASLRFIAPRVGEGPGSLSAAGTVGSLGERLGRKIGAEKTNDLVRRALTGGTPEDKELLKILIQRIPDKPSEVEAVKKLRGHLLTIDERDKERDNNVNVQKITEITEGE